MSRTQHENRRTSLAVATLILLLLPVLTLTGCPSGDNTNASNANAAANDNKGNATDNTPADNSTADNNKADPPKEAKYPYQVNAELARVYLKYNIIDEALRLFDLAITQQKAQTGSEDAENWAGLGDALVKANRKQEAAKAYSRALAIYKQLLPKAQENKLHNFYIQKIAVLCQVLGMDKDRKDYLSQLQADEKDPDQQVQLAAVLEQVGQKEKAEECYKRALDLTKDDAQKHAVAQVAYAGMLLRSKMLDEALELAKSAYDTKDLNKETKDAARRLLFNVYEARGEADKMEFK